MAGPKRDPRLTLKYLLSIDDNDDVFMTGEELEFVSDTRARGFVRPQDIGYAEQIVARYWKESGL